MKFPKESLPYVLVPLFLVLLVIALVFALGLLADPVVHTLF